MKNKFPKYPFLYVIKIEDLETSLEQLLKDLKKLNGNYRELFKIANTRRNVIHYHIDYDSERKPIAITIKYTNIAHGHTRRFYKFLQEHAPIEKYECIPNFNE